MAFVVIKNPNTSGGKQEVVVATAIINANDIPKKIKVIIYGGENTTATNNNAIPPRYW